MIIGIRIGTSIGDHSSIGCNLKSTDFASRVTLLKRSNKTESKQPIKFNNNLIFTKTQRNATERSSHEYFTLIKAGVFLFSHSSAKI